MTLFNKFIEDAIKNTTFVDIDRPNFESGSLFGTIIQNSEEFICLKSFDDIGEYDGIALLRKDDISTLLSGGNLRNTTEDLIVKDKEFNAKINFNLTSIRAAIESISSKFGHMSIFEEEYSESCHIGEVIDIDDEFLLLNSFGTRKSLDRSRILLRLDSISRIDVDGKYEKSILKTFSKIKA